MRILITGAHFTTAVAVIEELKKYDGVQPVYVGRKTTREGDSASSPESEILPKLGVKFVPIITGRLQRSFTIYTIPSLLKIPFGFIQSVLILLKEKPDVILSFGGYVAVPIVVVGWLFSIPIIIHEQTLVIGLSNKISSFFADKIAVSFNTKNSFNPEKVILTGNPIRKEILNVRKSLGVKLVHPPGGLPTILITGGNQGSHVINLAVEESLEKLTKIAYVIHQTGDSRFKDFERLEKRTSERYEVKKWIDDMGEIMKKVDLVVSRAGINTLSELAYLGIPALVIPVPYLYKNEQNENAKYFEKLGSVKILPQNKLNGENLLNNIKSMLKNIDSLKKDAKKAKAVIIPDAAKRLALETTLLAKRVA